MTSSSTNSDAGKGLLSGVAWMIGGRWLARCIGLVSVFILARLLAPADFGLMAIALIAYGLMETLTYAGVDLALMRGGQDSRQHFDTAWTIQIIQGVLIALALLVAAPLTAWYFSEPRAVAVIQLIALRSVIDGTSNIGVVAFRKDLDFAKEFRFSLYSKLVNFLIVVSAAYWFRNYWALVVGSVAGSIVGVVISYVMHPYRPRLSLAKVSDIWSFSQWLIIARLGSFLNRKTDEFIVGGVVGTSAMGNYHLASDLATMPSNELVMPMRRALFPTLSKATDNPEAFSKMVCDSFSAVAVLCLSVGFGLMSVAPEVVQLILGDQWLGAVSLIQWLAIFGAFSGLTLLLEVPLWVRGKTNLTAVQSWLELAVLVPLVWFAVRSFGADGAAAARTGVSALMVPVMMYLSTRAGGVPLSHLVGATWRPLGAAIIMALALHWLALPMTLPILFLLVVKVSLGAVLYPAVLCILWIVAGRPPGFEFTVVEYVGKLIGATKAGKPV